MPSETLFSSRLSIELHLRKSYLESQGIGVRIEHEELLSARPELPAYARLVAVDPADEKAALELLAQFESTLVSPADEAWSCLRCGELLEPQFTACWKCGFSKAAAK